MIYNHGACRFCVRVEKNTEYILSAASLDLKNNTLLNVGAAGNDWTTNCLTLAGGDANQTIIVTATNNNQPRLALRVPAGSCASEIAVDFQAGDGGGGDACNVKYVLSYNAASSWFNLYSTRSDGSGTNASIWRVPDGQSSVDANTTWDANVFDAHDDAKVLERAFSADHRETVYENGQSILKGNYDELIDIGVLRRYSDCWVGYNDQRMAALLAGGIYQTRSLVDGNHACHEARIKELEAKLGGCSG